MMREKKANILPAMVAVLFFCVATGCYESKKYTYPVIQKEYAARICLSGPSETSTVDLKNCGLLRDISLSDAISIALKNSPDSVMAIARIRKAAAMIEKAEAQFYPALGFYTEYMQGDAPSANFFKALDQRQVPRELDFNDPGWFENYESGVTASMNLFNGGRDLLERRMAETGLEISQLDRRRVENALVAAVIHSYYNSLASADFIEIARQSVSTVASQLKIMQVRYAAGGALKSDILSLEVRLGQAREDEIHHRNRLKMSLTALAAIMGINPETSIKLRKGEMAVTPLPETYATGIMYAMAHRPDIQKVRQQVVKSRMALAKAGTGYYPRVDLVTKYYLDDPDMHYSTGRENWNAAVVLNWDFFSGFSTRAEVNAAEAALEEMLSMDRKTILAVKSDVRTAYLKLSEARARLEVAQKSVDSAEESLKIVKQQYEGGSTTITRYLEAELDRNNSRTRTTAAFYNREKAFADAGRAIGYWAVHAASARKETPHE